MITSIATILTTAWFEQVFIALILAMIANILAKWSFSKLSNFFLKRHQLWQASFIDALYYPLITFIWFSAIIYPCCLIPNVSKYINLDLSILISKVVAIGCLIWFLYAWKNRSIQTAIQKQKMKETTLDQRKIDVLNKLGTVGIAFIAILLLLEISGQSFTTLIAFGGIGGLAIAFASQEVISNFFSGIMIYLTQPFNVGDWVRIPERHLEGIVEEIGWYMTKIRTFEKIPVYVPNSSFAKLVVENPSRMTHRQFKETIQISYNNADSAQTIIREIDYFLRSNPEIDQEVAINVHLEKCNPNSIEVIVSCYTQIIDGEKFAELRQQLLFKIIEILRKNNIQTIPNGIILREKL